MTEKSRDLADIKTGNINLQPIKDIPPEVQTTPVPIRTVFDPPPSLPPSEFQNGTFVPGTLNNDLLSSQGMNEIRPEVIAHTVFEPLYGSLEFTSKGTSAPPATEPTYEMIKTQWSARKIREENLVKFVDYLKNDSQTKEVMAELSTLFNESIDKAEISIEKIKNIWIRFDEIMYAFDMYTSRSQVQSWRNNIENETDVLYTLDEVFSKLGYNTNNIQYWTNTRTVGQLLLDLSYAARLYSLELFSDYVSGPIQTIKNVRIGDNNPLDYSIPNYSVTTKYDVMSGKNSLSPIEKYLTDESLSGTNGFADQSLLLNTDVEGLQRLRVLATTLSRILGLSRVYTDTEFSQQYLNVFGSSLGTVKNFIMSVIGNTTKSIVDPITSGQNVITSGQNVIGQVITTSRTSLHALQIIDEENKILPLERRDVSATGTNEVTAGSGYDYFFNGLGVTVANNQAGSTISTQRIRQFRNTIRGRISLASRMIEVGCLTDTYASREKNAEETLDLLRADKMLLEFRELYKKFTDQTNDPRAMDFRAACYYATINPQARQSLIRYTAAKLIAEFKGQSFIDSFATNQKWSTIIGAGSNLSDIGVGSDLSDQDIASDYAANTDDIPTRVNQFAKIASAQTVIIRNVIHEIVGREPKDFSLAILPTADYASWKEFLNLIQRIEDAAGNHTDTAGNTWHMHVSSRTRFLFYIDMLITMIGYTRINYFAVPINDQTYSKIFTNVTKRDQFLSDTNNPFIDIAVEGCKKDRYLIQSITSLLRAYVGRIDFFVNKQTEVVSSNYRDILISKQQTALSMLELDDVKWAIEQGSIFSDDNSIPEQLLSLMLDKLFTDYKYREKKLTRILTLGMCPGTNSIIEGQDRTTKSDVPRKNWRSSDFVNIKVYVKNLLEEDIVFKPLEFPFELSRFVNMRSFKDLTDNIVSSKSYSEIVFNHVGFIDTSVMSTKNLEMHTYEEAINFERYQTVKATLMSGGGSIFRRAVRNHVTSYLLGLYIKLLSGVSTQEKSFLLNPDLFTTISTANTDGLYKQLFEILIAKNSPTITLQQFLGQYPVFAQKLQSIQEGQFGVGLFEDATIVDPRVFDAANALIAEDLLDISKLLSVKSSITAGEKVAKRIESSKLFERIFNIPVHLPDFEIDTKLTKSTYSGNAAYNRLYKAGMLMFQGPQSEKVYYKWGQDNMQALQMWMTISTLDVGGMKQVSLAIPKENPIKNQLGSAILEPTIPQPPQPLPPKSKLNQLLPQQPPPQPSQPSKNILTQLPQPSPSPSPKPPQPPKKVKLTKF